MRPVYRYVHAQTEESKLSEMINKTFRLPLYRLRPKRRSFESPSSSSEPIRWSRTGRAAGKRAKNPPSSSSGTRTIGRGESLGVRFPWLTGKPPNDDEDENDDDDSFF